MPANVEGQRGLFIFGRLHSLDRAMHRLDELLPRLPMRVSRAVLIVQQQVVQLHRTVNDEYHLT